MNVQCCETYEEIRKGDAGRVTKVHVVKRIGTVITLPELTKHCL